MSEAPASIWLKKGREKPVINRHPWIFSGAVETISGKLPQPGDIVEILDAKNHWLARGYYNPTSQIAVRILTWDRAESTGMDFWRDRIARAIETRKTLGLEPSTNAYRIVNAEADGLPGLVVDRYGEYLAVQLLTAGVDVRRDMITDILNDTIMPQGIVERSDVMVRRHEGLEPVSGLIYGDRPPVNHVISENGLLFHVDILSGQKTGFYLDQRDNRRIVCTPDFVSGKHVLNVFSYTGGFSIYAAKSGARATCNIDVAADALESAERNLELNSMSDRQDEFIHGNAFEILREYRDTGRFFDMVILDPPKFAQSKKDVPNACRGYKDLNWLAMRVLKPGGILATFSCSGLVSLDLFQKVVFGAAVDAQREVQILNYLGHSADHPVLLSFPESAYLKGFLCRVH